MITYANAKKLLPPGDEVYTIDENDFCVPARVIGVYKGYLETDLGILDFDDHGETWLMTKLVSREKFLQKY